MKSARKEYDDRRGRYDPTTVDLLVGFERARRQGTIAAHTGVVIIGPDNVEHTYYYSHRPSAAILPAGTVRKTFDVPHNTELHEIAPGMKHVDTSKWKQLSGEGNGLPLVPIG